MDEVVQVLQQLKREGKTPSIALIKGRLSVPVPLPVIVSLLAKEKANVRHDTRLLPENVERADSALSVAELTERVQMLEQHVATLQRAVAELQA
ncbi:MAG: hypothetical protein ACRC53_07365 [Plesiomonas sp.]|uniref:hypothetical protein n=1 Tax=Plesiomonas sp. TaxID=2486279 RepID=UPI003F3CBD0A